MDKKIIAHEALDSLIKKSRVHLYKPIQIAEILYRDRVNQDINLLNLEDYRNPSKKWRDIITLPLLGRICTSSAKFQDNLFDDNVLPPKLINELGKINRQTNGAVEAYIYNSFIKKHVQLSDALDNCLKASRKDFSVKEFIDSFWNEPGLRRSIDKVYEIIVYSLFSTIVETVELKVEIFVDSEQIEILREFEDFAEMIMCIDAENTSYQQDAHVYRVGVTNAADRGLDMYSNWGPAIQIKHLSLSEELAQDIVSSVSSDKIVIVCKDAEKNLILSLLTQIGWKSHIQSIVTETNLVNWYEKALRGEYGNIMGDKLLSTLCEQIANEFPSADSLPDVLLKRNYKNIDNPF